MRLAKIRTEWLVVAMSAIAVVVVLALSAVIVAATGGSPYGSLKAVLQGSIGSQASWSDTLLNATPLLIVAVGTCICARAGEFSIGQEGQVLVGALAASWICLRLNLVGPALVIIALFAAALAGGVWASLSSLMKRISGVNVVVSTLLMNFVAQQVVNFAVNKSWFLQEQQVGPYASPTSESDLIPSNSRLGSIGSYPNLQLNLGLFLGVVLTVVVTVLLARSRWGFRLRLLGLSKAAARHAGVRVAGLSALALAVTGAFAGLAGAFLVTTPVGNYRLQPGTSHMFGWDGLLVALVAGNRPAACVPFALLFGMLRSGGNFISSTGVPSYIVDVVKALLVLAFVAPPALVKVLQRRMAVAKVVAPTAPVLEGAAA